MKIPAWLSLLLVVLLTACATTERRDAERAPRRNPDLITAQEIQETNASDALAIVQRLRPNWLSRRGADSINLRGRGVVVYVNGTRYGSVESLRAIAPTSIRSIQYLNGVDASSRFGLDHNDGAILVSLAP